MRDQCVSERRRKQKKRRMRRREDGPPMPRRHNPPSHGPNRQPKKPARAEPCWAVYTLSAQYRLDPFPFFLSPVNPDTRAPPVSLRCETDQWDRLTRGPANPLTSQQSTLTWSTLTSAGPTTDVSKLTPPGDVMMTSC